MKTHRMWQDKFLLLTILCLTVCTGLVLASLFPAWALQPPRPGEIERLKAEGKFESSLEMAKKVGNHKVDPYLIKKLQIKIERLRLKSQGMSESLLDEFLPLAAPPPDWQGGVPSTGNPRIFALLIEFKDETHTISSADIDDMLWDDGDPADYPLDSLTEWYDRSSYGLLDLSNGDTLGWYQTADDRSAVVETSAGREDLIKEALDSFDDDGHDFSVYDNDNDGDIEYFIVLWAGPHGDWATFWWGWNHMWNDSAYTIDGKTLFNYSWQWESDDPKVVIHETGHSLGLPDYYDYDDAVGPDGGVGGFDMMDVTGDHNCFSKWMLDWLTPTVVSGSRQDLTLDDSFNSADCVLIWPGVSTGDIFSEFFMVQNRQNVGNDESLWFAADGLAVWHVDSTLNAGGTDFAFNNSDTAHKLIRLMEADGLEEIETATCILDPVAGTGTCSNMPWRNCLDADGNPQDGACQYAGFADLYNAGDEFDPDTTPSSDKYDGTDSCVRVWNIADLGGAAGAEISAGFSTICNQPPISDADGPYTAECQGTLTDVLLDGTGSSDPDGDPLTYAWTTDCPGGSFDDDTSATPTLTVNTSASAVCPLGCNVTLTVSDGEDSVSDTTSVTILDTTPPVLSGVPVNETVECDEVPDPAIVTVTDNCDLNVTVNFTEVRTDGSCPNNYTLTRTWTATDGCGNFISSDQIITVQDTIDPVISFNAPPTIIPPDAPISFTATATDNCDENPSVEITGYDCFFFTKKGKRIDKTESCVVSIANDTITILDSGGVDDHITWTTQAADSCGNVAEDTIEITVVNPAQ